MRLFKKPPGFFKILAPLLLWSSHAVSMMASDGPPPCETEECFVKAVSACTKDASYMPASAAGSMVQYVIDGGAEDGRCRLAMIYMMHPNNEWTYKPLYFVVDPDRDIDSQVKEGVSACINGTADSALRCEGPLLELTGAET
ncbi:MAG: hypothetical protein ABR578_12665 [Chromatocurvus sp.]